MQSKRMNAKSRIERNQIEKIVWDKRRQLASRDDLYAQLGRIMMADLEQPSINVPVG